MSGWGASVSVCVYLFVGVSGCASVYTHCLCV